MAAAGGASEPTADRGLWRLSPLCNCDWTVYWTSVRGRSTFYLIRSAVRSARYRFCFGFALNWTNSKDFTHLTKPHFFSFVIKTLCFVSQKVKATLWNWKFGKWWPPLVVICNSTKCVQEHLKWAASPHRLPGTLDETSPKSIGFVSSIRLVRSQ